MAQFREWIHTVHTELDASAAKPNTSYALSSYGYDTMASWTSEEDTESETEQSFRSLECRRKKPCAMRQTMYPAKPAAPVMIPARSHDFGWCDRDDTRAEHVGCACGNDCEEFFSDDAQVATRASLSSTDCASPREASGDGDFIFDLEM